MINVNRYFENISESAIEHFLKTDQNEEIIYGDYNFFIDFLKRNILCTRYICSASRKKSMEFLKKLINCFNLEDVNIDELYELINNRAVEP